MHKDMARWFNYQRTEDVDLTVHTQDNPGVRLPDVSQYIVCGRAVSAQYGDGRVTCSDYIEVSNADHNNSLSTPTPTPSPTPTITPPPTPTPPVATAGDVEFALDTVNRGDRVTINLVSVTPPDAEVSLTISEHFQDANVECSDLNPPRSAEQQRSGYTAPFTFEYRACTEGTGYARISNSDGVVLDTDEITILTWASRPQQSHRPPPHPRLPLQPGFRPSPTYRGRDLPQYGSSPATTAQRPAKP